MVFKIKQSKALVQLVPLCSITAFLFARKIPFVVVAQIIMYTFMVVFLVSFAVFLIDKYNGTSITIEEDSIVIQDIFGVKKVEFNEICDVQIKPYTVRFGHIRRTTHYEYRMKMTIIALGRKNIVLNDTASEKCGILGVLLGLKTQLRDEEVQLYRAYKAIEAERNQNDFTDFAE